MAVIDAIRSSGGNFTTLSTWEADAQGRFGITPDEYIAECYNDFGGPLDDKVDITGWGTTTADNHPTIRVAAGNGHGGDPSAGFQITSDVFGGTIDCDQNYIHIIGLRVAHTGSSAAIYQGNREGIFLDKLILESSGNFVLDNSGFESTYQNLLIHNSTSNACMRFVAGFDNADLKNITIDATGCLEGILKTGTSRVATMQNVVVYGATNNDINADAGSFTGNNNASGDTSVVDYSLGTVTGVSGTAGVDFVNPAGNDYNAQPSGKLDGAGADLSGTFTDDIAGNERSVPWEIGAYEIAAAGPTVNLSTLSPGGDQGTPSGPNGGYYTSAVTWEAAAQGWHTAGDEDILECYNFPSALSESLVIQSWASDVTSQIKLTAGDPHNGVSLARGGSGFKLTTNNGNGVVQTRANGVYTIDGIEIENNSGPCIVDAFNTVGNTQHILKDLICDSQSTITNSCISVQRSASFEANNCLITSTMNGYTVNSSNANAGAGNFTMRGCTVANTVYLGIQPPSGSNGVAIDCVSIAATYPFGFNAFSEPLSSNNSSSGTDAPGANPQNGAVITDGVDFVSPSTGDYTPQALGKLDDTGIYDANIDPDIAGFARGNPVCEIGAYEIQGVTPPTFEGAGDASTVILDADGDGEASAPALIGVGDADTAILDADGNGTYVGVPIFFIPSIPNMSGVEEVVFVSHDVSSNFGGGYPPFFYALAPDSSPLPPGLSVNPSTGDIEGTPTDGSAGVYTGIKIRATDSAP